MDARPCLSSYAVTPNRTKGLQVDAYSITLMAYLCVLSIVFVVFAVLRIKFPAVPPMVADEEQREFVARRCRDLNQTLKEVSHVAVDE
jgi:hypothetical protein